MGFAQANQDAGGSASTRRGLAGAAAGVGKGAAKKPSKPSKDLQSKKAKKHAPAPPVAALNASVASGAAPSQELPMDTSPGSDALALQQAASPSPTAAANEAAGAPPATVAPDSQALAPPPPPPPPQQQPSPENAAADVGLGQEQKVQLSQWSQNLIDSFSRDAAPSLREAAVPLRAMTGMPFNVNDHVSDADLCADAILACKGSISGWITLAQGLFKPDDINVTVDQLSDLEQPVRPIEPTRVEHLLSAFTQVGVLPNLRLIVQKSDDGKLFVVDGAHRVAALRRMEATRVPTDRRTLLQATAFPAATPPKLLTAIGLSCNQSVLKENALDSTPSGQLRQLLQQLGRAGLTFQAFSEKLRHATPSDPTFLGSKSTAQAARVLWPVYLQEGGIPALAESLKYVTDATGEMVLPPNPLTLEELLGESLTSAVLTVNARRFLDVRSEKNRSEVAPTARAAFAEFFEALHLDAENQWSKAVQPAVHKFIIHGFASAVQTLARLFGSYPTAAAVAVFIADSERKANNLFTELKKMVEKAREEEAAAAANASAAPTGEPPAGTAKKRALEAAKAKKAKKQRVAAPPKPKGGRKGAGRQKGEEEEEEEEDEEEEEEEEEAPDAVTASRIAVEQGRLAQFDTHGAVVATVNDKGVNTSSEQQRGGLNTNLQVVAGLFGSGLRVLPHAITGATCRMLDGYGQLTSDQQGGMIDWYQTRGDASRSSPAQRVQKGVLLTPACALDFWVDGALAGGSEPPDVALAKMAGIWLQFTLPEDQNPLLLRDDVPGLLDVEREFGLSAADRRMAFFITTSGEPLTSHVDEKKMAILIEPRELYQQRQHLITKAGVKDGEAQRGLTKDQQETYLQKSNRLWDTAVERLAPLRNEYGLPPLRRFLLRFKRRRVGPTVEYFPETENWASLLPLVIRFGADGGGTSILTVYHGQRSATVHQSVPQDAQAPSPSAMDNAAFHAHPCAASLLVKTPRFLGLHSIVPHKPLSNGPQYLDRKSFNMRYETTQADASAAASEAAAPTGVAEGDRWSQAVDFWQSDFALTDSMRIKWETGILEVLKHFGKNPRILPAYMRVEIAEIASILDGQDTPADLLSAEETKGFMDVQLRKLLEQQPLYVPWLRARAQWPQDE